LGAKPRSIIGSRFAQRANLKTSNRGLWREGRPVKFEPSKLRNLFLGGTRPCRITGAVGLCVRQKLRHFSASRVSLSISPLLCYDAQVSIPVRLIPQQSSIHYRRDEQTQCNLKI
jgi:hypothetical protein